MRQEAGQHATDVRTAAVDILDYTRAMAEAAGRSEWEDVLQSQREQDLKIRQFFSVWPNWGQDADTVDIIRQISAITDKVAQAGQVQRERYAGELRSIGQGMRGQREYLDTSRLV